MRHYPALSRTHLNHKYGVGRRYAENSLARGWSRLRSAFNAETAELPNAGELKTVSGLGWDKSAPWKLHPFLPAHE